MAYKHGASAEIADSVTKYIKTDGGGDPTPGGSDTPDGIAFIVDCKSVLFKTACGKYLAVRT